MFDNWEIEETYLNIKNKELKNYVILKYHIYLGKMVLEKLLFLDLLLIKKKTIKNFLFLIKIIFQIIFTFKIMMMRWIKLKQV